MKKKEVDSVLVLGYKKVSGKCNFDSMFMLFLFRRKTPK